MHVEAIQSKIFCTYSFIGKATSCLFHPYCSKKSAKKFGLLKSITFRFIIVLSMCIKGIRFNYKLIDEEKKMSYVSPIDILHSLV